MSQNAGSAQLAAYVPEGKGSPGFVGVWPLAQLSKNETPPPTARRSFFRVKLLASQTLQTLTWLVHVFHEVLWCIEDSLLQCEPSDLWHRPLRSCFVNAPNAESQEAWTSLQTGPAGLWH